MIASHVVGEWRKESGRLLSLKTPALGNFSSCGKKLLLSKLCEGAELRSLAEVKESRWNEVFTSDSTQKGRWRVLYKPPFRKRVADL